MIKTILLPEINKNIFNVYKYFLKYIKKDYTHTFIVKGIIVLVLFMSQISNGQNCTLNANVSQTICANESLTLLGSKNGSFDGTGDTTWSQVSGPSVVINAPNSLITSVSGIVGGNTYKFRLSSTCLDGSFISNDVTYVVKNVTIANAGPDQIPICPGSGSLAASPLLAGETGVWTIVGDNNAGIALSNSSSANSSFTAAQNKAGSTTLRWTLTSTSGCVSFDEMIITNRGGVTPIDAGDNIVTSNCYSATQSTTLAGSFAGSNIYGQLGTWSVINGPNIPILSNKNSNTSKISNLIEGVYVIRWTVSGACVSGFDEVQITVPAPVGSVTTSAISPLDIVYCDGRTSVVLSGTSPLYNNEVVTWVQTQGPIATIVNPNSATTTITGLDGASTYSFTYTVQNTVTNCSSSSSSKITYATPPSLNVTSSIPLVATCDSSSASISYTTTGTGAVTYSIVSGPVGFSGVPTAYASLPSSPATIKDLTVAGTYVVRLRKSANGTGCSDIFKDVTVVISQTPTASNPGTGQILACNVTSATLSANIPTIGAGSWSQTSGPSMATISDIGSPLTDVSNLVNGEYKFRWKISGGPSCASTQNDVSVVVASVPPSTANAGSVQFVCANTPISLAANKVELNEVGAWSVSPSSGVVFSPNINDENAVVTGLNANTAYTFTWTITNACSSSTDSVVITTSSDQGPVQSNAGTDQCKVAGTTTITLNGNNPSPGIGSWTKISGPAATITNPSARNTTVTGITNGTYEFQWEITYGTCASSKDRVLITISDPATTAAAGADQNICGTTASLVGNTAVIGTGVWTQVSGNGGVAIANVNAASTAISGLTSGSYVFRWTISNNACTSNYDEIQVNVSTDVPVTPLAGSDQFVCGLSTVTMAANSVSPSSGLWSIVSGPNVPTITNATSPTTTITGLNAGTYVFRWTSSGGAFCTPLSDDVTVSVTPTANAGSDQDLCFASSANLSGNDGSVGTWIQIGTSPNVATISATSPNSAVVSGLTTGTYTFQYTISANGSCPTPSTDTVSITNFALTSAANAGTDQQLCNASSFTLAGNSSGSFTGKWKVVSGPSSGSFSPSDSSANATFNGAVPGLYIFSWTIGNSTCNSVDEVRIENFGLPTTANAGPDQVQVCDTKIIMAANLPSIGLGNWSLISKPSAVANPSITSTILPTTEITNVFPGTYIFRWTVSNGTCPSSFDDVSVTVYEQPTTADAGSDQILCNATTTTLNAVQAVVGTGLWTKLSGPAATITNPTLYNTTVTGLTTGDYEFQWTTSNAPCSLSDTMNIINDAAPSTASTLGTTTSICLYTPMNLVGNNPTVGTGIWSQTGGAAVVILNPTSPTTAVAGAEAGVYTFSWTISNGSCPSSTASVSVTVLDLPSESNAGPDQTVCDGTNATLAANTPANGTGTWSFVVGGVGATITSPNNPNTTVSGLQVGVSRLRWTISNGLCGSYIDEMNVTVNPTGQVTQPSNQVFCNNSLSTVTFATTNSGGTTTYAWTNDNAAIGLGATGTGNLSFTATNSSTAPITGTIVVTPTFTNGGTSCSGPTKTFTITVNPSGQVTQPSNQVFCNNDSTTLITFGTTNSGGTTTYSWTNDQTSIGLSASGTNTPTIPSFTAINTGTSPVVATIVVTPTFTNGQKILYRSNKNIHNNSKSKS